MKTLFNLALITTALTFMAAQKTLACDPNVETSCPTGFKCAYDDRIDEYVCAPYCESQGYGWACYPGTTCCGIGECCDSNSTCQDGECWSHGMRVEPSPPMMPGK